MTDAMVQLAKEFLEVHGYTVSTSVKMPLKRKEKQTESDVDIIAHRYKKPLNFPRGVYDELLNSDYIIAEVKGTLNGIKKGYFKEIYNKKFRRWNEEYLKRYVPLTKYQRILFCFNATQETVDEAKAKKIQVITAAHMLKALSKIIINKMIKEDGKKKNTYYTEWPIYSSLRELIYFLNEPKTEYGDKLLLEDLLWITARARYRNYRNKFIDQNRNTLVNLLQGETGHKRLDELMEKLKKENLEEFYKIIKRYSNYLPQQKRNDLIRSLTRHKI